MLITPIRGLLVSIEKVHKDLNQLKESQLEILNLGGAGDENIPPRLKSRKKTKLKIAAGIGSLAAITGLGSTLAASISLNSGQPVEFGQGVATTAACNGEEDITFTPNSTYLSEQSIFVLESFTLSNIDMSAPDPYTGIGCAGKVLIVRAFTDQDGFDYFTVDGATFGTSSPLYLSRYSYDNDDPTDSDFYNSGIAIKIADDGLSFEQFYTDEDVTEGRDDFYSLDNTIESEIGSVTITFGLWTNSGLNSAAIDKFTVESVDEIDTENDWYSSTY